MKELLKILKASEEGRRFEYKKPITRQSKYLGVNWDINKNKWEATIYHEGKRIYVGGFKNDRKAHEAIKKKRIELKIPYKHNNEIAKIKKSK